MDSRAAMQSLRLQQYAAMVKEQQSSGLSVTEWCKEQGMKRPTYYRWLKMVKRELKKTMLESMGLAVQAASADMAEAEPGGAESAEDALRYHTEMVVECQCSGLGVKEWCKQNNLSLSAYYRRRKEVQEAALAYMGEQSQQVEVPAPSQHTLELAPRPRFAELPTMPCEQAIALPDLPPPAQVPDAGTAIRIQMGSAVIEIQKETDAALAESVVRALAKLC